MEEVGASRALLLPEPRTHRPALLLLQKLLWSDFKVLPQSSSSIQLRQCNHIFEKKHTQKAEKIIHLLLEDDAGVSSSPTPAPLLPLSPSPAQLTQSMKSSFSARKTIMIFCQRQTNSKNTMHIMQVAAELCKLDAYFHSLCRGLRSHLFDVDAYSYSELSNPPLLVSTGFFTPKFQAAATNINEALPLHTIT